MPCHGRASPSRPAGGTVSAVRLALAQDSASGAVKGGSHNDRFGVSFGGSTSAENVCIVEGLNTTDPAFGVLSTDLPNEFVGETEDIDVSSGGPPQQPRSCRIPVGARFDIFQHQLEELPEQAGERLGIPPG